MLSIIDNLQTTRQGELASACLVKTQQHSLFLLLVTYILKILMLNSIINSSLDANYINVECFQISEQQMENNSIKSGFPSLLQLDFPTKMELTDF